VVKEVHGAGGYGMLVGPAASKKEIEDFRAALLANPAGYIAQPTLALSTCPTFVDSGIAPRHIDLRPFVLSGKDVQMVPGGLTRVALKDGSLVAPKTLGCLRLEGAMMLSLDAVRTPRNLVRTEPVLRQAQPERG
jgi:uncharacterized circularly permuted ATP-grasp superfamily protein